MKRNIFIVILSLVVFVAITILTADEQQMVDGDNRYGFPITFYIEYSRMCDPCPDNYTELNYLNVIADLLFASILSLFLWKGISLLKR
jgi:hypothetical protein